MGAAVILLLPVLLAVCLLGPGLIVLRRVRMGKLERLVAAVGLARARFLIFTAAEVDAHAALAMGLVGDVVAHARLDERVGWALEQIRRPGPGARAGPPNWFTSTAARSSSWS